MIRPCPQRRVSSITWLLLLTAVLVVLAACASNPTPASNPPNTLAPTAQRHFTVVSPTATRGSSAGAAATVRPSSTQSPSANLPRGMAMATPGPNDRLKTIRYDQLPPQAKDTAALIGKGGPFPYRQDGVVFENREGVLPRHPKGYYHEYTVVTPGSSDRGARRLVQGSENELYYTDDHYATFRRVVP